MDTASLGASAALGSSITWAFASGIFARIATRHGAAAVALARGVVVAPIFLLLAAATGGAASFELLDALLARGERFSLRRSAAIAATVGGVVLIVANAP